MSIYFFKLQENIHRIRNAQIVLTLYNQRKQICVFLNISSGPTDQVSRVFVLTINLYFIKLRIKWLYSEMFIRKRPIQCQYIYILFYLTAKNGM